MRKFNIPDRAINQWNILPEEVTSIHNFKGNYYKKNK